MIEDQRGELALVWPRRVTAATALESAVPDAARLVPRALRDAVKIRSRMALSGNTGVRRIVNATFFSFAGLRTAWRTEAAFRQECLLCIVLIPAACWLGQNAVERSLLIGVCLLVLVTELLNTAVEYVVDRVGTDQHQLSGHAKDLGSAAVFVSLVLAAVVWGLIGWQRFA